MPGPTKNYLYRSDDDPISLANQFGTTPQQLISANPGGYPFTTGQAINIPYQYQAPVGPQPAPVYGYNAPIGPQPAGTQPPPTGYGPNAQASQPTRPGSRLGAPYGPGYQMQPNFNASAVPNFGFSPTAGSRNILYQLAQGRNVPMSQQTQTALEGMLGVNGGAGGPKSVDPTKPYGGFQNKGGSDNSEYANTAAAQYYEATGTPWLEQKRWDPNKKKYISIRDWLKGSRKKGGRGGGGGGGGSGNNQQKKQEYALANTIIDFGISAG